MESELGSEVFSENSFIEPAQHLGKIIIFQTSICVIFWQQYRVCFKTGGVAPFKCVPTFE